MIIRSLREALSDVLHDIWTSWMQYLFEKCPVNEDGTATISAWAVENWNRQIRTSYAELTEKEKDSDREQADKIIAALKDMFEVVE